jgi:hypothetical protein
VIKNKEGLLLLQSAKAGKEKLIGVLVLNISL